VVKVTRRRFVSAVPAVFGGGPLLSACSRAADPGGVRSCRGKHLAHRCAGRHRRHGVDSRVNPAQLADPAFVRDLKSWIRFNGTDAGRTRDGPFSVSSGNPAIPAWLGDRAFGWFFTAKGENEKIVRQVRNATGIVVFIGEASDKAHWVEVDRAHERCVLQATAPGIRNAFLNQPVEVAAVRGRFAAALGLGGRRPDLVVRFGRGPALPRSLRRPVDSVMV
jgi:hypothetical protein